MSTKKQRARKEKIRFIAIIAANIILVLLYMSYHNMMMDIEQTLATLGTFATVALSAIVLTREKLGI